jgi:hypothetical protein
MAAPARPVAGAVIASAWGDAVHDAVVNKIGCVVFGGTAVGAGAYLNLAYAWGSAYMVDAPNKRILIPSAGIWRVDFTVIGTGTNSGGLYRAGLYVNGAQYSGCAWPSQGAVAARGSMSMTRPFAASDSLTFLSDAQSGTGASSYVIDIGSVTLEATDWAY